MTESAQNPQNCARSRSNPPLLKDPILEKGGGLMLGTPLIECSGHVVSVVDHLEAGRDVVRVVVVVGSAPPSGEVW